MLRNLRNQHYQDLHHKMTHCKYLSNTPPTRHKHTHTISSFNEAFTTVLSNPFCCSSDCKYVSAFCMAAFDVATSDVLNSLTNSSVHRRWVQLWIYTWNQLSQNVQNICMCLFLKIHMYSIVKQHKHKCHSLRDHN